MTQQPKKLTLRGQVVHTLQEHARPRDCDTIWRPELGDANPSKVVFTTASERATTALACVVLEQLRAAGGACVSEASLSAVLERCMDGLTAQDRMMLEIEAWSIFEWLGRSLQEHTFESVAQRADVPEYGAHPDLSTTHLLSWAITWGHDLDVTYYDPDDGSFTRHTLTPTRIEAQHYVRALSHTTMREQIFEIHRLSISSPTQGWPVRRVASSPPAPAPPPIGSPGPPQPKSQLSLLGREGLPLDPDAEEE